ncbi:MAG TPA: hypothetical protein VIQ80_01905 [Candidatus Saccharimonadales bacterium]
MGRQHFKRWSYLLVGAVVLINTVGWQSAHAAITAATSWGTSGTGNGQFSSPTGITVASNGDVYVGENGNHRIQVFDANGTFKSVFNSTNVSSPQGLAFDGSGNLWVADTATNNVKKFNSSGVLTGTYGSLGAGNGQFNTPSDLAIDSLGNVYVADYSNSRIQKLNSSGAYVTQWGTSGAGAGQFNNPIGVAVDSSGNVYTTEDTNCRVQKFTSTGTYITSWGSVGSATGQFLIPQKLAIDTSGNVYVVDAYNVRLQKFSSTGTYLDVFAGPFYGVAVNNTGNIYAVEYSGNQVQKLTDSAVTPANSAPNAPSALGPSEVVNWGILTSNQPTMNFTLSDPNAGDTVKYNIQIDDTLNFSSPLVDYTSALGAQGTKSFTVGQAAGSGTYAVGSAGQQLPDGLYYWRIKAVDNSGAASPYVMAHGNTIAFAVDTTAPSSPGVPTVTSSPLNVSPSLTWYAASDSGAGLATTPYIVEWSKDPTFATGVSSASASGVSFTVPYSLSPGTWYFRVKAIDASGRVSAYSAAGSVTIARSRTSITSSVVQANEPIVPPNDTTSTIPTNDGALLNTYPAFTESKGAPVALKENQAVHFTVGSERHSATVKTIDGDYVVITLASTPRDIRLMTGQTASYDVTGDGKNDITITLTGIKDGVAQLVFAAVEQPLQSPSGSIVQPAAHTPAGWVMWAVWAAAAMVAVALIVMGWRAYTRRRA